MVKIETDKQGQLYIEWEQGPGGYKRAWIQRRDPSKDWASAPQRRYLNVARVPGPGIGPGGNATDFPIFSDASDEQILFAFVYAVSTISGIKLP